MLFRSARYIYEISKFAVHNDSSFMLPLQPRIRDMSNECWIKTLCYCLAYLRRYKMDLTLQTIKIECPKLPKSTGFSRTSDLDKFWRLLKKSANSLSNKDFNEWVIDFKEDLLKNSELINKNISDNDYE